METAVVLLAKKRVERLDPQAIVTLLSLSQYLCKREWKRDRDIVMAIICL